MTYEEIRDKYEKRIRAMLQRIAEAVEDAGYRVTPVQDFSDIDFRWGFDAFGATASVVILFVIGESEDFGEEPGGVCFYVDVIAKDGEVLGSLTPRDPTYGTWIDQNDAKTLEKAFRIFEFTDPREVVELFSHIAPSRKRWRPQ